MSRNGSNALSFHNSHIKWILFTYSAMHLLTAGAALCVFFSLNILFRDYSLLVYSFVVIELVLAAECLVIRPFLKQFSLSGLFLFFLYIAIRLIINVAAAIFLLARFPDMFPDLFALVFSTASNLVNTGMSVLYAAPLFVVCLSNIFLCVSSLIYYVRRRGKFK